MLPPRSPLRGALATTLLVAGCAPAAPGDARDSAPVVVPPAAAVSAPAADSLRLRVEVPAAVREGAPVPVTLRVENVAPRPVELYLRGRTVAFDVVVARADGTVAWRRLEGEVIPAIVQLRVLAPGETLALQATWDQRTNAGARIGAGRYTVRALLLTDRPEPLETPPAPLEIAPGRP